MLPNGIDKTTFSNFRWLVIDTLCKYYNFKTAFPLSQIHIEPVEQLQNIRPTRSSTKYPREIWKNHIRKKKVVMTLSVSRTGRHDLARQKSKEKFR